MKLVVLDGYANNPGDLDWSPFKNLGELKINERTSKSEVRNEIKDADMVFTNKVRLGEDELKGTNVKYIGVIATGFDIIDLAYCKSNGIRVTNVPGYSSDSVCQMTFAHILNYLNRVDLYAKANRVGKWRESRDFVYYLNTINNLSSLTLGIYGFGSIGKKVYDVAKAFGMKVIAYDHKSYNKEPYVKEDEFLRESDIISLHAPLNDSTYHFINEKTLEKAKDGVIIVNTARGSLVDENDLIKYLDNKKVKAYLSDVLEKEPMREDHPFEGREDVFLTPHLAWASYESRDNLIKILFENAKAYLDGKDLNVVV